MVTSIDYIQRQVTLLLFESLFLAKHENLCQNDLLNWNAIKKYLVLVL